MAFRIALVTATKAEGDILTRIPGIVPEGGRFSFGNCDIRHLVTGVGPVATAWSLTKFLAEGEKPMIVINTGIAGSFRDSISVGEVVMPVADCFADLGIDTGTEFIDLFDAGLDDRERYPFEGGWINLPETQMTPIHLRNVRAITVNTASGSEDVIKRLVTKYNPDIETMEGASFFYICAMEKVPCVALRAISNIVGPRQSTRWDIPLALNNLSQKLKELLENIH